jgi:hypothetical protein
MTNVPNIAIAAADRRVRMLESASKNEMSGTRSMKGTAQGRVVDGSNGADALAPEAAPDAAANMWPVNNPTKSEAAP